MVVSVVTTQGWGQDALLRSTINPQVYVVSTLIDKDVDPNPSDDFAKIPLEAAIEAENMKIAGLKNGRQKNRPALTAVVEKGNAELVHTLLDLKADPNVLYPHGNTALAIAVQKKRLDLMELLFENRAHLNPGTLQNAINRSIKQFCRNNSKTFETRSRS